MLGSGPIVTLDAIAADPRCAASLPQSALMTLLLRAAAVQSALTAHLAAASSEPAQQEGDDQILTPEEATILVKQSRRWLARNAHRLPFIKRVSPRRFVCSKRGIERWLATSK